MGKIPIATTERQMVKLWENKKQIDKLKEENDAIQDSIIRDFREMGISNHQVVLDEHYSVKVSVNPIQKKKFDKEKFATDLGIAESDAGSKDLLIKMTEKGKLTLQKFKTYFYREEDSNFMVRRIKNKTLKSTRKKKS